MLSVPIEGQYEQELNARYLAKLGYGAWARDLDADAVAQFLEGAAAHSEALQRYVPQDNHLVHDCLAELLRDVSLDEPRPDRLETEAMGRYEGPLLPEEKG
jgi:UDP-N-acetylglucosamine:LPS N-acetylglucosamine transferase